MIDEMDGVKRVGAYWVNRVSGMGVRSPFVFDHVNRILRFKGFSEPIHESEILIIPPDPDWDAVRFNESLESINCGYYFILMKLWLLYFWSLIMRRKGIFSETNVYFYLHNELDRDVIEQVKILKEKRKLNSWLLGFLGSILKLSVKLLYPI